MQRVRVHEATPSSPQGRGCKDDALVHPRLDQEAAASDGAHQLLAASVCSFFFLFVGLLPGRRHSSSSPQSRPASFCRFSAWRRCLWRLRLKRYCGTTAGHSTHTRQRSKGYSGTTAGRARIHQRLKGYCDTTEAKDEGVEWWWWWL